MVIYGSFKSMSAEMFVKLHRNTKYCLHHHSAALCSVGERICPPRVERTVPPCLQDHYSLYLLCFQTQKRHRSHCWNVTRIQKECLKKTRIACEQIFNLWQTAGDLPGQQLWKTLRFFHNLKVALCDFKDREDIFIKFALHSLKVHSCTHSSQKMTNPKPAVDSFLFL